MLRRSSVVKAPFPPSAFTPKKYQGPQTAEVLEKRKRYMLAAFVPLYKTPLHVVEGHAQWLWDAKGDRYLDMFGAIVTVGVGHSNPRIAARVQEIATTLNHTSMAYVNNVVADYCEALASTLPKLEGDEWQIHMTNSGSETTDFAIILSRIHTGNHQFFCVRNGYHGHAEGARSVTSCKGWKHNLPGPTGITRALCPHPFWGKLGTKPEDVDKYLADLEQQIFEETPGKVAGMIIEPFQGAGGCVPLLPGYQRRAYEIIKKYGGLCISDEVQTGFGRTGKAFWGFEIDKAQPDIVDMAKSGANGWPFGSCAIRKSVADSLKGVALVNTFGGNAMTAAVAHEVLKIIKEDKLQENCANVGGHMKSRLQALQPKYPAIGQVRGEGLLQGVELVKPGTKDPDTQLCLNVLEYLKENKVLVGKGGPAGNVVRISPPMIINKADVDYFVDVFEAALAHHSAK